MRSFLNSNILPLSVFITGACVLIVEITATRVLSPYYGNTIFTVSSVISVILAALSIGYYQGGKLSDKYPSEKWFFWIIAISGLILLISHLLSLLLLPKMSIFLSITTGPLISSFVLFFIPALLLGTLSPFAVKLQAVKFPNQGIGSVAGKMFFWSTLGSIIGSLVTGFILIPKFGINDILTGTSVALLLLGLLPLYIKKQSFLNIARALTIFILVIILTLFMSSATNGQYIYVNDGVYEKLMIYDGEFNGRPARFFQQDRSNSGAMYLDTEDPTDLVYDYTKYYEIHEVFRPDIKNVLVIGGGVYSIPKAIFHENPSANIDVSEIEPSLFELSKTYFKAETHPKLQNSTLDGRQLLSNTDKKYDLIFSDVYYSLFSIPAHFTTKEFFEVAKRKLSTDGVFIANLIGDLSRKHPSLIMSEIKTFQQAFPNSYFFAVEDPAKKATQNIIFVGYNSKKKVNFGDPLFISQYNNPFIQSLSKKIIHTDRFELTPYIVLTDNYSPTEYLTSEMIKDNLEKKQVVNGSNMLSLIDQQLRYGARHVGSPGHEKVKNFLIAEMKTMASDVKIQNWTHTGQKGNDYELTNVIGKFNPSHPKRLILATHYDSQRLASNDQNEKTKPVPGANDSASGVAILLELAYLLHTNPSLSDNLGIDIVFFDGEEGDGDFSGNFSTWFPLGSTYFAENIHETYSTDTDLSAIVLDMVCDKDLKIHKEPSSVRNAQHLVESFWLSAKKVNKAVFSDSLSEEIRDDHTSLNSVGIPSLLLIDFDYPYFHTTADTLDKCSADSLRTVTNALLEYISTLNK